MPELSRQSSGRRGTWLCGICAREIAYSHVKRHLAAHDRHGSPRDVTDEEWLVFLDTTGWPTGLQGAMLLRRPRPSSVMHRG